MVQAARSGVQNIAEGSQVSGTSKKMEIKLTNVARASLEELRLDYEDFLRQRGQELWPPDHPSLMRFKNLRCKNVKDVQQWVQNERRLCAAGTHKDEQGNQPPRQNGVSVPANASPSAHVPRHAQFVANAALSLLNIGCYLLDRQIKAQAAAFEKEGGFTERLYRVRQQNRARPKNRRE